MQEHTRAHIPSVNHWMEKLGPEAVSGIMGIAGAVCYVAEAYGLTPQTPFGRFFVSKDEEPHTRIVIPWIIETLAQVIEKRKEAPSLFPSIVGIIGPPAVGKSEFARKLAHGLNQVIDTATVHYQKNEWPDLLDYDHSQRWEHPWQVQFLQSVVNASFRNHIAADRAIKETPATSANAQLVVGLSLMWHFVSMNTFYHIYDDVPKFLADFDLSVLGIDSYYDLPILISLLNSRPRAVFFIDAPAEIAKARTRSAPEHERLKRLAALEKFDSLRNNSLAFILRMREISIRIFGTQGAFPIYYVPTCQPKHAIQSSPPGTTPLVPFCDDRQVLLQAAQGTLIRIFGEGILPPLSSVELAQQRAFSLLDDTRYD